jgi:hypothetical protein
MKRFSKPLLFVVVIAAWCHVSIVAPASADRPGVAVPHGSGPR